MVGLSKIGMATVLALVLLTGVSACGQRPETSENVQAHEEGEAGAKYAPVKKPSAIAGQGIYKSNCEACHGPNGAGDGPTAESLPDKPRDFTDLKFMRAKEPRELFKTIANGKGSMPAFRKRLSDSERWDAFFYVWSLATSPARIADGKDIFQKSCTTCHGKTGNGKGAAAGALKEKPPKFNDPKFMMKEKSNRLYKVLTDGKKPMPAFKSKLKKEQRWNTVDYIWTFVYKPMPE